MSIVATQNENEKSLVVRFQHYAETMKSDFEASLDLLSDDIVWVNLLPANVPFGGKYVGKQEVVRYFTLLAEAFVIGEHHWEKFDFIESGNTLVMVGSEDEGKVISTGKVFDLNFVWVIRFDDDGKICYVREHNDTAAIGDAFKV